MRDKKEFFNILTNLDGREFSEYTKLIGDFDFSRYVLKISSVQEHPGADPSVFVVRVPQVIASFPARMFNTPVRRTALEDMLARRAADHIEMLARYDSQGVSRRRLAVARPGQKILPRTSVIVTEEYVEMRLYVELPDSDGHIRSEAVKEVFFDDLPEIVTSSMIYCNLEEGTVEEAVDLMEDADHIRRILTTRGLVSFVAEGSLLSRIEGTDYPDYDHVAPFVVADGCSMEVDVPHANTVKGLGIPRGITLILGDEYSGRVELMKALAAGIYNHVNGDGRERVVTVSDAVYVSAEPGRSVQCVDLSPFARKVPGGQDPARYTTDSADAFSSQAASTVEALEIGARVLLFDESDSSPAFLSSDSRLSGVMNEKVTSNVPLLVRARQIVDELGVSLVVGGHAAVAEYLSIADTVLKVDGFEVRDITEIARRQEGFAVSGDWGTAEISSLAEKVRWIVPSSIDASIAQHDSHIETPVMEMLDFGRSLIDLSGVTQIADIYQTSTIGLILYYAKLRYLDEARPLREVLDLIDRDLSTEGLECLTRDLHGDLARPRRYEIAAVLNRFDTLRIMPPAE